MFKNLQETIEKYKKSDLQEYEFLLLKSIIGTTKGVTEADNFLKYLKLYQPLIDKAKAYLLEQKAKKINWALVATNYKKISSVSTNGDFV